MPINKTIDLNDKVNIAVINTNINYIKTDIGDIKIAMKELNNGFISRITGLESRVSAIEDILIDKKGTVGGIKKSWAFVLGCITLIAAIIALVLNAIRLFQLRL